MKTRPVSAAVALILLAGSAFAVTVAPTTPKPPFTVKVIGFNDYHGNLETPGTFGVNTLVPTASRPAVGGAEYMAAYVARMKATNPLNVVVGAGDFIGATPLISALFFDEPAVETLNQIGVEFNAVGNHEFDKGKDELKRLQNGGCKTTNGVQEPNSCKGFGSAAAGTFDGARFKWLSANVVDTATGKTLLPAYGIKSFNGVKVAFIGMTLKGTRRASSRPPAWPAWPSRTRPTPSTPWCPGCVRKASSPSWCWSTRVASRTPSRASATRPSPATSMAAQAT